MYQSNSAQPPITSLKWVSSNQCICSGTKIVISDGCKLTYRFGFYGRKLFIIKYQYKYCLENCTLKDCPVF